MTVNAQNDDTQQDDSLPTQELLELLGQFEQQDENWVDNEMNSELSELSEKNTGSKNSE